jgi:hypothetical protein
LPVLALRFCSSARRASEGALTEEIVDGAVMRGWRSISARLQASDARGPLAIFVDLFSVLMHLSGALGCEHASLTQL